MNKKIIQAFIISFAVVLIVQIAVSVISVSKFKEQVAFNDQISMYEDYSESFTEAMLEINNSIYRDSGDIKEMNYINLIVLASNSNVNIFKDYDYEAEFDQFLNNLEPSISAEQQELQTSLTELKTTGLSQLEAKINKLEKKYEALDEDDYDPCESGFFCSDSGYEQIGEEISTINDDFEQLSNSLSDGKLDFKFEAIKTDDDFKSYLENKEQVQQVTDLYDDINENISEVDEEING